MVVKYDMLSFIGPLYFNSLCCLVLSSLCQEDHIVFSCFREPVVLSKEERMRRQKQKQEEFQRRLEKQNQDSSPENLGER